VPHSFRRFAHAVLWLLLINSSLAHAATLPAGFTESLVAGGLANPTAMEFAPDGRLFVLEQAGRVRIIKNGALLPTPFLTLTVHASGERGLLGIAFDPDFSSNQYVYLYYTATTPVRHNRISRFTANGDAAVSGSELVLVDLAPLGATNHNGGAIHFGADGKLYAAVGDNAVSDNAQSLASLNGKILRINKDGTIPEDNPFYGSASGVYRAIWAIGLRNPFTFAVQPITGELHINDVGSSDVEEINYGVAGANYGWPDTEGTTTDPRYQTPRSAYPHGGGVCAIAGGAFYEAGATQFPSGYVGDYFFADYCGGWIRKLDSGGGTNTVAGFATGISSPVDLKVYDGALYYLARGGGSTTGVVYRIAYGGSSPSITSHPASQTVNAGDAVTFSVGASGAGPLTYQWQRNAANIAGAASSTYTIPSVAQSDDGATFRAIVSNTFGSTTSNEATLTVTSNAAPTAAITEPAEGWLYSGGSVITYAGTGMDPEDGTLPGSAFTWQVDFHHDSHLHPFVQPTSGSTGGTFTVPTTDETSANVWYRIHLTVRDSGGRTHHVQRDVFPRKSRITIDTNPSGLQVKLDGQPLTTPASFDAVVGIVRTLEAVSPQVAAGSSWDFASWSDGGAARHSISTPATDTTYVARFQAAPAGSGPVLEAHFDSGADGFTYLDDAFRGTNQPSYAAGAHAPTEGFAGGGLKVTLGGINENDIVGMSGGWRRTFTLPAAGPTTVSFRYRLDQTPEYESDESSEVLLEVDALLAGTNGTDYVARLTGNGSGGTALTTGWQLVQIDLGTLQAGTHTLTIGGYNSKKTNNEESTVVLIDDLVLTSTAGSGSTPVLTAIEVSPASADVPLNGTQQFTAQGRDQDGNAMAATVTWAVSGGGTIDATGRFTATAAGGPFTVSAQDGAVTGSASVTVSAAPPPPPPPPPPTGSIAVAATNGGDTGSTTQSAPVIRLPAGIAAGDLLIVAFSVDGKPTLTWPSGWNVLLPLTTETTTHSLEIRYKIASGSEAATFSLAQSGGGRSAHTTYRITGHDPSVAPQAAAAVIGSTGVNPDPPRLTPTAGAQTYLWLAVTSVDNVTWSTLPSGPAGYSDVLTHSTAVGGGRARLSSARSTVAASSEDPTPFTIELSDQWIATTIAIKGS